MAAIRSVEDEKKRGSKNYKGKQKMCEWGSEMAAKNYSRYKLKTCPLGEEGP